MNARIQAIALLLGWHLCLASAAPAEVICVTTRDADTPTYIELDGRPKVTFEAGNVLIRCNGKYLEYPLSNYITFTFTDDMSIRLIQQEGLKVKTCHGRIELSGLKNAATVAIFSLDGKLVASGQASAQGQWSESVAPGTYILRTGTRTIKMNIL